AIYVFQSAGATISFSEIALPSCRPSCTGEGLTFPMIAVGNVDVARPGKVIVVVGKSKLIVLTERGEKIAFRQFVDARHGFTDYDPGRDPAEIDDVGTDRNDIMGRRYGHMQL